MWYYSPTKNKLIYQVRANTYEFWLSGRYGKYNSIIYSYSLPWDLFPQKWCMALNSLFWSPPTAVHRFGASDMAVPGHIFLSLPWVKIFWSKWFVVLSHSYEDVHTLNVVKCSSMYYIIQKYKFCRNTLPQFQYFVKTVQKLHFLVSNIVKL